MAGSRLDSFPLPVRLCIGNHDNRAAFLGVFPEYAEPDGFAQGFRTPSRAAACFLIP